MLLNDADIQLNQAYNTDCLAGLKKLADNSIDSIVTDPPYELTNSKRTVPPPHKQDSPFSRHRMGVNGDTKAQRGFMGKEWDGTGIAFKKELWEECLRVLKPGGYLLAFGGTRTYHRMACAIEDAGFEIRDQIQWIFGSGFPKNLNISKKIDQEIKKEWSDISEAVDNISVSDIIIEWKKLLNTVKFVKNVLLKNTIEIGINMLKNDSVPDNATQSFSQEKLPLNVIIAELKFLEVPLTYNVPFTVPENVEVFSTQSQNLVIPVEQLLQNPNLKQFMINSIAQCAVKELVNENTENNPKDGEALKIWLGKKKFLNAQDINVICVGLIEGLKRTILNQSKIFQNLDTISQMECVSAITVTITEFTAECLISSTVAILKNKILEELSHTEREVIGFDEDYAKRNVNGKWGLGLSGNDNEQIRSSVKPITAPATDEAKKWASYGTALKPANEPICIARKPLEENTVAKNVIKWGTGGINIDDCRVPTEDTMLRTRATENITNSGWKSVNRSPVGGIEGSRWPANLIHDGSEEVVALFPITSSGAMKREVPAYEGESTVTFLRGKSGPSNQHGDSGSAARFFQKCEFTEDDFISFYSAKASKKDRGEGNTHPTVKPLKLMEYLVRLVTPKDGICLDIFCGSGTTLLACQKQKFNFLGFDSDVDSIKITEARLAKQDKTLF